MWTAKWILEAYESGDDSVRANMYMTYRDLRGYFDQLEPRPVSAARRAAPQAVEEPPGVKGTVRGHFARAFGG